MICFQCDYAGGAHPEVLKRLVETNGDSSVGYGLDGYCGEARSLIKAQCGRDDVDVHFMVGGTGTNATVIAAALKPYQGVISPDTGHIAVHESGAVEAAGHKVLTLPSHDGRLSADEVRLCFEQHRDDPNREHTVQPHMVYISFPTESGTIYSKKELCDLSEVCREFGALLYVDGARLGYGLCDPRCDITLGDLCGLCDAFYIGGTKCGLLFGEALVIANDELKSCFRYMIKQRGGMLAKGRLLGVQFGALFKDGLYFKICREAVEGALEIRRAFESRGVKMFGSSLTNQQFPVLTDAQIEFFKKKYLFEPWGKTEGGTAVRFCVSPTTGRGEIDSLIADIELMPQA